MEPGDIIDVGRYPILGLESREARSVVEACRAQLCETGLCLPPDFVCPEADAAELATIESRAPDPVRPRLSPGTISIFNGHRALHRVAPVTGARECVVALFNYAPEPDYVFSDVIHRRVLGRAARDRHGAWAVGIDQERAR